MKKCKIKPAIDKRQKRFMKTALNHNITKNKFHQILKKASQPIKPSKSDPKNS